MAPPAITVAPYEAAKKGSGDLPLRHQHVLTNQRVRPFKVRVARVGRAGSVEGGPQPRGDLEVITEPRAQHGGERAKGLTSKERANQERGIRHAAGILSQICGRI